MAGGSVIGALRVVLGADSAQLEKGLKDTSGKLQSFASSIGKIGAAAGAAFGSIAVGMAAAVKGTLNEADKLGKMAQSVGVPVEELSALKHAADLSDVSIESLGAAMGRLSRNMMQVAGGVKNDVSQAFAALGISVKSADGSLKSSSQVLTEIAGKFAGYKDGAAKTAIAIQLLGRAGADLIPMLNQGADGMRDAMEEAKELGLVIDSQTSMAAENFNDNLNRLGKAKDGIVYKITAQLAPAFAELSERLVQATKDGKLVENASGAIINVVKWLSQELAEVSIRVQGVAAEFKYLWQALKSSTWEGMKQGFAAFFAAGEETEARVAAMRATFASFWQAVDDQAEKGMYSLGDHVQRSAELMRMLSQYKPDAPIVTAASEIAKAAAVAERELQKLYAAAKRTFEQTRTPAEEYSLRIAELNRQFQVGGFSADTYARAVAQAQDKMIQASPVARSLGNAMESAFDRAIQGGNKLSDVLKNLLADLGRALANEAFKTILYGNASSGGTSSGLLGGLLGLLPKFADGGSFKVGGSGVIDSQLVSFWATPGEHVTVSNDAPDSAGGTLVNATFPVSGGGSDPSTGLRAIKAYVASPEFDARWLQAYRRASTEMKI
jgi:hypothetical protein